MNDLPWLQVLRNVNVNQLMTFIVVADKASFRSAAQEMHLSQSAVSVHVRQLEVALGVPLLHRTTRSVELSREGQQLYEVGKKLIVELADVTAALHSEAALQNGVVSMAVLPSVSATFIPQMMRQFRSRQPGIDIRLHDADSQKAASLVHTGRVDLGILPRPEQSTEYSFVPLFHDPFVVVVPARGHRLSMHNGAVSMAELADDHLLLNPRGLGLREALEEDFLNAGFAAQPVQELTSTHALVGLVGAGFGITVLPRMALHGLDLSECAILETSTPVGRELGILTAHGRTSSPPVEAVIHYLRKNAASLALGLIERSISQP